jgi:dolichol-phosphate mannosyltransferase
MLVTIVVPTYKECDNLRPLVERVFKALRAQKISDKEAELIVVDDNSQDGSVEVIEQLASEGYNARIIVRRKERGLSSAVLRGFDEGAASSSYLICMDADLQHPPESVPQLLAALRGGAPFVIGTRYAPGTAVDKDWPLHRRIISGGARALARPLTALSDPMSGFFGIDALLYRRSVSAISPVGFKIALECFVKSHSGSFEEVTRVALLFCL